MGEPRRPGWTRSAGSIAALGLAATGIVVGGRFRLPDVLVGATLIAVLSIVAIPTRSRVRLTPATSVVAALPLIRMSDEGTTLDLPAEMAVVMLGAALVWLVGAGRGEAPRSTTIHAARLLVAGLTYVTLFDLIGTQGLSRFDLASEGWLVDWWQVVALAIVTPIAFIAEGLAAAIARSPISRSLRSRSPLELRDFDVYLTLVVSGALFGLTFGVIGWFALVVAGVPFLLALGSFHRLADTRRTYSQTVRALAQIPEAAGHVDPGHAVRVAELATMVARYLGLAPVAVEEVSWAAYLHDIGRISLNDPGVVKIGYTEADIAEWGSVIVEEATLSGVAQIIRLQHEPYRRPGQQPDPDLPIASRIVKVASAYDDLIGEGHSLLEALEQLHRGSVYDYDPDIVNAVRSVLSSGEGLTRIN